MRTLPAFVLKILMTVLFFWAAVFTAAGQDRKRPLGEMDLLRIRELHRITDTFGQRIWPGYDTRKIPIAVNNDNRQELLVNHPKPPEEFKVFEGHDLDGSPVMIRDGCTRYGPRSGGWAMKLGGEETAYVGILREGLPTERYLSLLLHECFHVFQPRFRSRADGPRAESPTDDPGYSAMIGLESRILHAALHQDDAVKVRSLARMFIAVRRERRKNLTEAVCRHEDEQEFSEGTATYVQARMFQLLAESKGLKSPLTSEDPQYSGFEAAKKMYQEYLARILPSEKRPVTFMHAQYNIGMALGLLLDRVRPGWKKEMKKKGMTQFTLLEQEFAIVKEEEAKLAIEAKNRFDHKGLLARQKSLVEERLDTIRGYLYKKGRRYRVFHGNLPGRFKWKPRGPVYRVPPALINKADREIRVRGSSGMRVIRENLRVTVWAGGIRRFEKGTDLVFESRDVPVIYRFDYLEWIDPESAEGGAGHTIRSHRDKDGVHHGLTFVTAGFTLKAARARIEVTDDIVAIHPLPAPEVPARNARSLYDGMMKAMRDADTLAYRSAYRWEARGKELGRCIYEIRMKKPNHFRLETERADGKKGGILIGDGDTMWIHWPNGRPFFSSEDPDTRNEPRDNQYMKKRTPVGRHSIGHQTGLLGAGMSMAILDPSTFHGYTDSLQKYLDGVENRGTAEVGGEMCDVILVSFMKGQRTWRIWISRKDHLPRKLRQEVHVSYDIISEEVWSKVVVNGTVPDDIFVWKPPAGWKEWRVPRPSERLLKPGVEAPDFTLTLRDGGKVTLSDFRGKVVWLNIWRVG